jgi:adenine-specific DNA-methyltransferase
MSRNPEIRDRARELRRAMTPAESTLWKHVRGRRFAGFKFRRQCPLGPYFADLACHECRLIIEVDGETHLGNEWADERRTRWLNEHGWLVLRFWNTEVFDETEAVLEAIYQACEARRPSPPHPQPLSPEAGERGAGLKTTLTPNPSPPGHRGKGEEETGGLGR